MSNTKSGSCKFRTATMMAIAMLLPVIPCAHAETSNPLFSISIPSSLAVETDNEGRLIASGPHGEEGLPFLFVYFCAFAPNKNGVRTCDSTTWHPLDAEDIRKLRPVNWTGVIAVHDRGNDVTEWSTCAKLIEEVVTCYSRLRSQSGYIQLGYMSDAPQDETEKSIEAIVASIKWH